jgi:hypothetical protein
VFFSRGFVVNGESLYKGTRGVPMFFCCNAGAVDYQLDVVVCVKVLAFDLRTVAQANPAAHADWAPKLLNLHERCFLAGWWIPLLGGWASFEESVDGCWCSRKG